MEQVTNPTTRSSGVRWVRTKQLISILETSPPLVAYAVGDGRIVREHDEKLYLTLGERSRLVLPDEVRVPLLSHENHIRHLSAPAVMRPFRHRMLTSRLPGAPIAPPPGSPRSAGRRAKRSPPDTGVEPRHPLNVEREENQRLALLLTEKDLIVDGFVGERGEFPAARLNADIASFSDFANSAVRRLSGGRALSAKDRPLLEASAERFAGLRAVEGEKAKVAQFFSEVQTFCRLLIDKIQSAADQRERGRSGSRSVADEVRRLEAAFDASPLTIESVLSDLATKHSLRSAGSAVEAAATHSRAVARTAAELSLPAADADGAQAAERSARELAHAQTELSDLGKRHSQLQSKCAALATAYGKARDQLNDAKEAVRDCVGKMEACISEVRRESRRVVAALEDRIEAGDQRNRRLAEENAALAAAVGEARRDLDGRLAELDRLRQARAHIADLETQRSALIGQLEAKALTIQSYETQVRSLRASNQKLVGANADLDDRVAELQSENRTLFQALEVKASLAGTLRDENAELSLQLARVDELQTEVRLAERQNRRLAARLEAARKDAETARRAGGGFACDPPLA
jgi:hypothetical protein